MTTEEEFQARLKTCCDMANTYLDDLKQNVEPDKSDEAFDSVKLQDTMAKLARVLSHDATKLTLACKPPRKPEDATRMLLEISNTFYRIVGFYRTIPAGEAGHVFKNAYHSVVRQLLHSLISLCSSFMTSPLNKPFMVPTAALWETCEKLEKEMPKNNEQAVRLGWKQLSSTLADAKQEVHDIDRDEVTITEDADGVVEKCQKSVDLAAMILLKVERRCLAEGDTAWLDRAYEAAETLTDEADVVVSQLYEVESKQEALDAVTQFRSCIADLIRIAQEVAKDEHATWFQHAVAKLDTISNQEKQSS